MGNGIVTETIPGIHADLVHVRDHLVVTTGQVTVLKQNDVILGIAHLASVETMTDVERSVYGQIECSSPGIVYFQYYLQLIGCTCSVNVE